MQNRKTLETQIRESLSAEAGQVAASAFLKVRLRNRLESRQIKEDNKNTMKKIFTLKRVIALAAVVCCLGTAAVFASGSITRFTSMSSKTPTYTSIPTAARLEKDIGCAPKVIHAFSNGYTFKDAKIVNGKAEDDSGKNVGSFKQLEVKYELPNSPAVQLYADNSPLLAGAKDTGTGMNYNGIALTYITKTYKFVPENYKMTADDQKAKADGSIVFSYGSDDGVSVEHTQFVEWAENGIHYQFMTQSTMSEQSLMQMAQEVISQK